MKYLPAIVTTLAVCLVLAGLIWAGWRHRIRRQQDVAAPAAPPWQLSAPLAAAEGQYVSTTTAGDWLDRIAVHQLGFKANGALSIHLEGVLYARTGAPDVFIPAADLDSVRRESGMAGKFVEKDGLVVVAWRLGGHDVDTGFRPRRPDAAAPLVAAVESLISGTAAGPAEKKDTK
ncbi:hypothetical protein ACQ7DA_02960 [Zafaria sp. J156]|uniref:PH-like domain-containing protein n=1 Tax=Zafaria sp. J156 TaxID=3116490 RepID=UPI002E77E35B|nr:hypothetical protein [Zafaria sp. J156]MEE1621131.1 hypothetical protein [Zafaria sp. J156]